MLTKEQLLDLVGVLATASMIGVGFAIGGTFGDTVTAGIGITLSGPILQCGHEKLKQWLSGRDGVLNHDIQLALARAFGKALTLLEEEYFKPAEANGLSRNEKDSIKAFFRELKEQKQAIFVTCIRKAVSEQEVKDYLYDKPEAAADKLWERLAADSLLAGYSKHFRNFLRENLRNQVLVCFGEELKTDNRECNKAWRAFQRLLLEGIRGDVRSVQASQDVINRDLQILEGVRQQLDQLKDTIDHRLPNEPFQAGLETAMGEIRQVMVRVEQKLDVVGEKQDVVLQKLDVVVASVSKPEVEIPKVPDDIQALYDEAWALRDLGKYEDARITFQKALEVASSRGHSVSISKANYGLAVILNEGEKKSTAARELLQECLREFKSANSEKDVAATLHQLGVIAIDAGSLDEAEAYLFQALELDKKHKMKQGIGHTLHQLGWVEDHRGNLKGAHDFYDQALTNFLSEYQEGNPKTAKDAIHGIAGCYQHKGLLYEREGNVEEVGSNYMRALEWHRKSGFKPDVGKILYLLARFKYREGEYDIGTKFLEEAADIYKELEDRSWYARCLDLKGRLHFTLERIEDSTAIFESALEAVKDSGNHKEEEEYLNKLGHVYLEAQKVDDAKKYFIRARDLSLREALPEGYATSVKNLAQVAHIERDDTERDRLLSEGIQTLETLLPSVQGEPRRAFIIGQIGWFYEGKENFQQALVYYQRAKRTFEALSDVGGIANALGSMARMKGLLGRKNEEFDAYRDLKKLVDGSPYYDLNAGADINLAEIQIQIGNLDEARVLYEEAESLCRKYNLHYLAQVQKSLKRLAERINIRRPPELTLEQLLEELFEWVAWFPEAKDSILRLWMWGRLETLLGNYRHAGGVKFMVCQDNVDEFLEVAKALHPFSALCLQVVSSEYPGTGFDVIPFPKDKKIFFDCAIPYKEKFDGNVYGLAFLSGGMHSRYTLTAGTTVRSKITGNDGVTITGWSLGLPDQAHQLILSASAADLLRRGVFFLPYERHLANDKLMADLRRSKELGLVPVYFGSLPASESAEVLASESLKLPVLANDKVENLRKQVRKIKRDLSGLSSISRDSAQTILNDLTLDVGDLTDDCPAGQSLDLEICVLQYPAGLDRELQAALVINWSV
jgi:tetratricopeptide (TPR) repeat protein